MNMETKTFSAKGSVTGAGTLTATFSTFDVVDHDGDVTLASAIADGTPVVLGSYNHSSHSGANLPIGKGIIRNLGDRAQIVATIFDTQDAKDEFAIIKSLGGLAEYSYTLRPIEISTDARELAPYGPDARRILKRVQIIEVCSVIAAAGIGTGTDSAKGVRLVRIPLDLLERLREVKQSGLMRLDTTVIDDYYHRKVAVFMNEEA